jgi:ketosteroid isomerase-like protein
MALPTLRRTCPRPREDFMRTLIRYWLACSFAALSGVATASDCGSLDSMRWLIGEWFATGEKSTWNESWSETSPTTWEGRGVESSKAEPARQSAEDLRLVEMGGSVFYVAKVAHNELPVAFRLKECGKDRLVFTNPAHDFPRRLDYVRQPDGRLQVRVSDGAQQGFTLDFSQVSAEAAAPAGVLAAEDARFAAMVAADAAAMRRWFAEDLVYVHSTGELVDRERLIEAIGSGKTRYLAVEPSNRQAVLAAPNTAYVHGLARIKAQAGPTPVEFQARYLAVYGLIEGAWRLRAWQSVRLP